MINRKRKLMLQAACLLLAAAMCLALAGCGPLAKENQKKLQPARMIGAAVWAADQGLAGSIDPPEADDISLKWVKDETSGKKLQFSDPDMMAVYVAAEWEDGELVSAAMGADDRFESAPWQASCGSGSGYDCEAALYFDPKTDFTAFLYKIYERSDGSLYVKRDGAGYQFNAAGGGNTVEEEKNGWRVKVTINYEPFEACGKMVVKQFDESDVCIRRTEFAPEDEVKLIKAPGCAYAVCQYIKGRQSEYRLVEDDAVFRVVINPDTGIGERRDIKLSEE